MDAHKRRKAAAQWLPQAINRCARRALRQALAELHMKAAARRTMAPARGTGCKSLRWTVPPPLDQVTQEVHEASAEQEVEANSQSSRRRPKATPVQPVALQGPRSLAARARQVRSLGGDRHFGIHEDAKLQNCESGKATAPDEEVLSAIENVADALECKTGAHTADTKMVQCIRPCAATPVKPQTPGASQRTRRASLGSLTARAAPSTTLNTGSGHLEIATKAAPNRRRRSSEAQMRRQPQHCPGSRELFGAALWQVPDWREQRSRNQ